MSSNEDTLCNMTISRVILRLKKTLTLKSDQEVADALKIKAGTLAQAKRRESIPFAEVITLCNERKLAIDYILLGKKPERWIDDQDLEFAYEWGSTIAGRRVEPALRPDNQMKKGREKVAVYASHQEGESMAENLNDSKSTSTRRFDKDEFAQVPMYDVAASAGHGALVEDEAVEGMLVFRNNWIRNELRVNPSELYLVTVNGDSMYPTLSPNDIILVHDTSHTGSVPCDGIYLLRLDGSLLVKRLQRRPNNRVKIISDNPSYEAYEVAADDLTDADFCVLGRVVWSGRKM